MKMKSMLWVACMLALTLTGCVSYTETEPTNGRTTTRQYGTEPSMLFSGSNNSDARAREQYTVDIANTGDISIDIVNHHGEILTTIDPSNHGTVIVKSPYLRAEPHRWTDRGDYRVVTRDCMQFDSTHQTWTVSLERR